MCDYGWDGYNVGIELAERRRAFKMAKKNQSEEETPKPTPRDANLEEETTKATEEQASDPAFTGGDKPKEVKPSK